MNSMNARIPPVFRYLDLWLCVIGAMVGEPFIGSSGIFSISRP